MGSKGICDCPARVLDPNLIGLTCGVCSGVLPPFSESDQRLLRAEKEREK